MSAAWMPPLPEMHGDEALLMDADELRQLQADVARAALEQAAKVCDSVNNYDNPMTATDCADAIRALAKGITP